MTRRPVRRPRSRGSRGARSRRSRGPGTQRCSPWPPGGCPGRVPRWWPPRAPAP
ncbi:hypothetical protein ACFFX0_08300 [Citricoccus parietis]|uniref:Uncharacterized protein n=1 Tax=Citricoccus parietis TaxID=592307 RepID=A0ABV5FWY5_9MICC